MSSHSHQETINVVDVSVEDLEGFLERDNMTVGLWHGSLRTIEDRWLVHVDPDVEVRVSAGEC